MPRFFIDCEKQCGDFVVITGDDAFHISRSLRMKTGETVTLCDCSGNDYTCEICGFEKDSVIVKVIDKRANDTEPPYKITLWQGIPKGDKMELIIQKAVECGVSAIVPVRMAGCIGKIEPDNVEKKLARWQKIANEAAMQSHRGRKISIRPPVSFDTAVREASDADISFACYEGEKNILLGKILCDKVPGEISFIVGPEGGFTPEEAKTAREYGVKPVSLGGRILRTETASLFVLSAISMRYELM